MVGAHKDSQSGQICKNMLLSKRQTPPSTQKLDLSDKRGLSPGHTDPSASSTDSTDEDSARERIQVRILRELQKMSSRLDHVKDQLVATARGHSTKDKQKLSTVKQPRKDASSRKIFKT